MAVEPAVDLRLADAVIELLDHATAAHLDDPLRRGSAIHMGSAGSLLMTGDLHDHGSNYQKILELARLDSGPHRYVVIHEFIHGPYQVAGKDLSFRLLARAAALKLRYGPQVQILLSNHELAQIRGQDILKGGTGVVRAFDEGLDFAYGSEADAVRQAMTRYVRALPLAVICGNGILCSHSLPGPRQMEDFDPTVLDRLPNDVDLAPNGSAYTMVWGRSHTQEMANRLAIAWGVRWFVMGHQPAEEGYLSEGDTMLVLASNHEHGMALPIDLSRPHNRDELIEHLVPLAGIVVK